MSEELFNTDETPFNLAGELIDDSLTAEGEAKLEASCQAEAKKAQKVFFCSGCGNLYNPNEYSRGKYCHFCQP